MLVARGMIDPTQGADILSDGVRPTQYDTQDVDGWLDDNCYVAGTDDEPNAFNKSGLRKLRLVDDSVQPKRDTQTGHRVFVAVEQLRAWVYLWADHSVALQWLGMDVGFGVFVTSASKVCPSIQGVADYEVLDSQALMQVSATSFDRKCHNYTRDNITVYGPLTLVNAACRAHDNVTFKDKDLTSSGGKLVYLTWKTSSSHLRAQQLFAAYPATQGTIWACHALGQRKCHTPITSDSRPAARAQ